MRKKSVKKLKKMANAIGYNKSEAERKKIYDRLKSVHKSNKKEI